MLRITYTGGDTEQRWLFDPEEVDMAEAERLEQALGSGASWDTLVMGWMNNRVSARRVLLWHLLRRSNPGYDMPLADVPNIKMGQMRVELGSKEIAALIQQYEDAIGMNEQQRQRQIRSLEAEFADAAAAEAAITAGDIDADPKEQPAATAGITPPEDDPLPADPNSGNSETAS